MKKIGLYTLLHDGYHFIIKIVIMTFGLALVPSSWAQNPAIFGVHPNWASPYLDQAPFYNGLQPPLMYRRGHPAWEYFQVSPNGFLYSRSPGMGTPYGYVQVERLPTGDIIGRFVIHSRYQHNPWYPSLW